MKRLCYVGFLATVLLGTGLHFLYAWRPIPLFGLFAPVNESVWGAPKAALLAVSGSLRGAVPLGAVSGFLLGGGLRESAGYAAGSAGKLVHGPVWLWGGVHCF